MRMDN